MSDQRTPQEIEYDRLALSTRTPAPSPVELLNKMEAVILEDEPEDRPLPPLAGYPNDRALIFAKYDDLIVVMDRRSGELAIMPAGIPYHDQCVYLTPGQSAALVRFITESDTATRVLRALSSAA